MGHCQLNGEIQKYILKVSLSKFALYFSLDACLKGLQNVVESLYSVYFEYKFVQHGEVWANDI